MSTKHRSFFRRLTLAAVVCVWPACLALANGDPFAGTHSIYMAYDENISDGVTPATETVDVDFGTSDSVTYFINPPGATMTRTANQLTLDPRPQTLADDIALNTYAQSNGTLGAIVYFSRELADPNDLHIRAGTWGTGATVTPAQLVGLWDGTIIYDDDLADDPSSPFTVENNTFSITDLGGSNIRIDLGGGKLVDATISGGVISATDPNFEFFRMITDGTTLFIAAIDEEEVVGAPGDVSAGIAMGTLIPEPTTIGMLAVGGLALVRRRRT